MIVVDASILTNLVAYSDGRGGKARAALSHDDTWVAPEHRRVEMMSAVRAWSSAM